MRVLVPAVFACSIIALLLVAGCADVNVQKKVGDFGTAFGASSEEQKAIDWFKSTYGDPTANNNDPARFVEPLVTSGISDKNLPIDKVVTFPQSGGSVYFFVIYDNFKKGDPITVSWTYLENGREVTSVSQQAGGDFGRFIVEFQKPDSGWGKGKQRLVITGDGATESVDFAIGDALQTTPLPYNPSGSEPGLKGIQDQKVNTGTTLTRPSSMSRDQSVAKFGHVYIPIATTPTARAASASTVDTSSDINNCGQVGHKCDRPMNSIPLCYQGQCTFDCPDDYRYCGDISEGCVALYSDNNHCGNCDTKCGAGQWCNVNHCEDVGKNNEVAKDTGETAGGTAGSGTGNPAGASGAAAASAALGSGTTGSPAMASGSQGSCATGLTSCNGACVNTDVDLTNCGVCGHTCPSGQICTSRLCISPACIGFPCPPLTHCEVIANKFPVCMLGT